MKRRKVNQKASKKLFAKSGQMMNSKNVVRIQRGGIRF